MKTTNLIIFLLMVFLSINDLQAQRGRTRTTRPQTSKRIVAGKQKTKSGNKAMTPKGLYELGNKYLKQGNESGSVNKYKEAINCWRKAAEQGYSPAQIYMGNLYESEDLTDVGINKDYDEAKKWYRKAAELGNTDGMFNLAILSREPKESFEWYLKGAELGDAKCQNNLGYSCYYKGRGTEKDYEKAFSWCMKAAQQGNPHACGSVGEFYSYGIGVSKNLDEAAKWAMKAKSLGVDESWYWSNDILVHAINSDDALTKKMGRAMFYYLEAKNSFYHDGEGYIKCSDFENDLKKAAELYRFGAEAGLKEAQTQLGILIGSWRLEKYEGEGNQWIAKAAAAGDYTATRYIESREDVANYIRRWYNRKIYIYDK